MNPVRQGILIDFLEWLRTVKPTVRVLASLTKAQFMRLVDEYESSKNHAEIRDHKSKLWRSWESTHATLSKSLSQKKAQKNWPK
jgi:hypothetical protein